MLTRIPDEKIANLCVKYLGWDEPVSEADLHFARELFDAQLEADQEKVKEIFDEEIRDIFDEMFPPPLVKPETLLALWGRLQALKQKWIK